MTSFKMAGEILHILTTPHMFWIADTVCFSVGLTQMNYV